MSYTIGFLVKKRFYLYALELISSNQLKVSIFHAEVLETLVNHIKLIKEAIIDHITSAGVNANRLYTSYNTLCTHMTKGSIDIR